MLHPADNHSLDFLSSVYLPYHQYWKDHAKSENGEGKYEWTKDRDKLLTYNGMDVCISRELLDWIWADVESMGLGEYYLSNIQPLYQPLLEISLNGVLVDQDKQLLLREVTKLESEETRLKLKELAGEDLVSKTGLSPLKLKKFFHDTLKLPKQYKITKKVDGKSKSVSLDAINLAKLAYRYKAAKEPAQLVVDYRAQMKKLESWLEPRKLDDDGYVRAQFSPTTEAGRLASRSHPMGRAVKPVKVKGAPRRKKGDPVPVKPVDRGYNLQNTKKEIREIYKPDPGCLLLEIDQCLTGDTLIETTLGSKPIKDIQIGDYVLSSHDRVVHWGEVTAQKCTGVKEICTVVIDSGESVTCSLSHRFLVIKHQGNGRGKWYGVPNHVIEEVEAQNLKPGDRLVPLRKMVSKHTGYEWLYSRSSFERTPTHELVAEAHYGPNLTRKMIHHKDENKLNNHPDNLEYLTSKEHNGTHDNLSRVDEEKRLKALRAAVKKRRSYAGAGNPNYGKRKQAVGNDLNHKVKEVIFKHKKEEVYSITVEPEHNYALSIGIFVKNSQVEDRMCKMYTRAPRLVELANRHPSVYDVHTHNATLVFGVAESQVNKDQRFLGKIVSHGSQRGMTGNKLSDKLLSDYDLLVPPDECQGMLNRFLDELWEIKDIFFPWVKQEIIMKGRLINSWGQVWNVKDETLDEDLYRRGYSFPMQSEAARMMFNWGLIPVHKYLTTNYSRLHSRINIPRHDALIMSVPFDHLYEVGIFTLANLERPREIMGNWLTVPCSIKVGLNDAYNEKKHEGIEFKSLPKRDEFMDRVKEALQL